VVAERLTARRDPDGNHAWPNMCTHNSPDLAHTDRGIAHSRSEESRKLLRPWGCIKMLHSHIAGA
jgi:hypothetical protein